MSIFFLLYSTFFNILNTFHGRQICHANLIPFALLTNYNIHGAENVRKKIEVYDNVFYKAMLYHHGLFI